MKIQTGQKSAQRIAIENAVPILAQAGSWPALHSRLAAAGMAYHRKGSGAVVQVGDVLVKASDVARAASLSALQKRLGPYQPPQDIPALEFPQRAGERRDVAGHDPRRGLAPQPLRPGQPGWEAYLQLREVQQAAKAHDTLALQHRQAHQRTALADKLRAERQALLSGDWT